MSAGSEFVVLLTPIFAWHPSPQMNTFVNKADLKGKSVFLVGKEPVGGPNKKALKRFSAKAEKAGANVVDEKLQRITDKTGFEGGRI